MEEGRYTIEMLSCISIKDLRDIFREEFHGAPNQMSKQTIIEHIMAAQNGQSFYRSNRGRKSTAELEFNDNLKDKDDGACSGIIEICPDGYGFLRTKNYNNSKQDIFVTRMLIRQHGLRVGDFVKGVCARVRENEQPALQKILEINGRTEDLRCKRDNFDNLIPCYPSERITLERKDMPQDLSIRCIDLLCPVGKGQRGLIVAPPKTGKTTLLEKIALSIEQNHPEIKLIILLIDERPEEVTEFKNCVNSEIVYSTFDEAPEHHIKIAELVINRAKRLVEEGKDVVVLLDSITKLTRAYNVLTPSSGKTLSGGLDPMAVVAPKKVFGSARNIKDGGSLTIIATSLVETGSRMDEVIYEEFKGTGNMEIMLSGKLSERRVFPAIDLYKSGTRKDELLLSEKELDCAYKVRKLLQENPRSSENFLEMLGKTQSNQEFIVKIDEWLRLMK